MDIAHFKDRDCFALLNLEACFAFKTETSISFDLGRHSRSRSAFSIRGWLDVHHPVQTPHCTKACLRIALPPEYLEFEHDHLLLDQFKEVIATVLKALGIPVDEIYEAYFFTRDKQKYLFLEEPFVMYSYRGGDKV